MTLQELFDLMREHLKVVIALPVVAAVIAIVVCWGFMPNQYTASTSMYVLSTANGDAVTNADLSASQMMTNDMVSLIKSQRIRSDAAKGLGLPSLADYDVKVNASTSTRLVTVSVTGTDRSMVAKVANAIAESTSSLGSQILSRDAVTIIDVAATPTSPSGPKRTMYTAVAILAGLFLAIALIVLRDMLDTKVRDSDEAHEICKASVIGQIPYIMGSTAAGKKKGRGSNGAEVQNAAKALYANIRFASVDNPIKMIAVTSSVPNEGKTTASIELAKAIASSGKSCLIIEGDMRRRSVAHELGVHANNGLFAVLSGTCQPAEAVVMTGISNLYFLDAEPNLPNPADVVSSLAWGQLMHSAEKAFDYVIIDTPPVGTFIDAAIMGKSVDATILVVRPNFAKREEVAGAMEQLRMAGVNVIGICTTFEEGTSSEYYQSYYKDGTSGGKGRPRTAARTSSAAPASGSPVRW